MHAARLTAITIGLALAVALGFLISAGGALADGPTDSAPVNMTFEAPEVRGDEGGLAISVRVTAADSTPIVRQPVEFSVTPDFLGERPVAIRTALTNADGRATVNYIPTWEGEHRITARFAGDETFQPAEATSVLNVSGVASGYVPPEEPLGPLRQWATPGAIAVVLTVWMILAAVLVRVGWGVWHSGQRGRGTPQVPKAAAHLSDKEREFGAGPLPARTQLENAPLEREVP